MATNTTKLTDRISKMHADYKALQAAKTEQKKEPNEFQKRIAKYADEIMALTELEDRRIALQKVPSDCRGWVEIEVRLRYDRRKKENT